MIALQTELPRGSMRLEPAPAELRRYQRVQVKETTWIRSGQGVARGKLSDMSVEGAFVETDMRFELGTDIVLRCYLSTTSTPLRIWGQVVQLQDRSKGRVGIGVRFVHLDTDVLDQLTAYLQHRRRLGDWVSQYSF